MSMQITPAQQPRTFSERYPHWKMYAILLLIAAFYIWDDRTTHRHLRDNIHEVHSRTTRLRDNWNDMSGEEIQKELDSIVLITEPPPRDE